MKIKLYDIFKERWLSAFDDIVFYSDPHFGDIDINKHFRYPERFKVGTIVNTSGDMQVVVPTLETVKQLDQIQIDKINSKCGKKTCLIVLGDVGDVEYIKKIKAGYKVLILGNHDKGASNYKRVIQKETKWDFEFDYSIYDKQNLNKFHQEHWTCIYNDEGGAKFERVTFDNKLFDEVYEGPLFISDKIVLSHEPIYVPFALNIHGHDHAVDKNGPFTTKRSFIEYDKDGNEVKTIRDGYWYNCCAESIDYTPVRLTEIVEGKLGKIDSIHRETIDNAIERKSKRSK